MRRRFHAHRCELRLSPFSPALSPRLRLLVQQVAFRLQHLGFGRVQLPGFFLFHESHQALLAVRFGREQNRDLAAHLDLVQFPVLEVPVGRPASGDHETVRQEVRDIADLLRGHRELSPFLANPSVLRPDKLKAFEGIVGRISLRPLTVTFLRVLLSADRLGAIESIVRAYEALVDERLGRVKAEVTTAVALDGEQQERLRQRLEQVAGKQVYLEVQQDPKILGGLVAQIGSQVYDGSLKTQLARLREQLVRGS